jgi:probable rRNA maturation factor
MKKNIINLQICCKNNKLIPKKSCFLKWINQTLSKKNINIITIRVVEKKEIQYLNSKYRGKNKSTNILSFPYNTFIKSNQTLLGDLVLCKAIIEEESLQYKKTLESYWAQMIIHGTLHLLGYDHHNKQSAYIMETLENKIMLSLNYAQPYQY